MIKIRPATENDKVEWNNIAQESPEATYAHTWEWKEIVEKGLGLKSLCLVAEDNGKIVGIFPAFLKPKFEHSTHYKIPRIFTNKYQIVWSPVDTTWDYGGPCILPNVDKNILWKLIVSMEKYAKRKKVTDIHISFFNNNSLNESLSSMGYRVSLRQTYIIDIKKNKEDIWRSLEKNARRYVNKSSQKGVIVREQNTYMGLKCFYQSIKCLEENDVTIPPYSFYKVLFDTLKPKNMVKIHNVFYDEKVIGGSLSIYFKDVVTFRYAKIVGEYQNLYAHYLLHWARIEESKDLGYKYIDMGGIPSNEKSGIYFFKTRWGGQIQNIDWYIKDIKFRNTRSFLRKKISSKLYMR